MYKLPQPGTVAKKCLEENLAPHGYFEVTHTPGLWKHITRPIYFSLVVDYFVMKYVDKSDADHLIAILKNRDKISRDWEEGL